MGEHVCRRHSRRVVSPPWPHRPLSARGAPITTWVRRPRHTVRCHRHRAAGEATATTSPTTPVTGRPGTEVGERLAAIAPATSGSTDGDHALVLLVMGLGASSAPRSSRHRGTPVADPPRRRSRLPGHVAFDLGHACSGTSTPPPHADRLPGRLRPNRASRLNLTTSSGRSTPATPPPAIPGPAAPPPSSDAATALAGWLHPPASGTRSPVGGPVA